MRARPSWFSGSVTIDGQPVPDGTRIEALIGDVVCGTATTEDSGYFLAVRSDFGGGNSYQEGCGRSGVLVGFRVGELIANETGTFSEVRQELDLTFGKVTRLPYTGTQDLPYPGLRSLKATSLWALLAAGGLAAAAGISGRRAAR